MRPIRSRKNLTVQTNTNTQEIIFEGKRATGIVINHEGVEGKVFANREIILSAGAINSPKLLMLSGIGNAKVLKDLGINPLIDSPEVGKNMQDHLSIRIMHRSRILTITDELVNLNAVLQL